MAEPGSAKVWSSQAPVSVSDLHRVGIRAMVNNIVVRLDLGVGEEGFAAQMFISHPFPFY